MYRRASQFQQNQTPVRQAKVLDLAEQLLNAEPQANIAMASSGRIRISLRRQSVSWDAYDPGGACG
jgi:hypothetical protein